jgi:nucleoside phosphorylase
MGKVQGGKLLLAVDVDLPEGAEIPLVRRDLAVSSPRCDVLLFVTTPAERQALREVAEKMALTPTEIEGRFSAYIDLGQLPSGQRVFGVETEMGALQAGGSATKGLLCPIETEARHVVAVGTAFGIDRVGQTLGDVLVATHVLPYDFVLVDTEPAGRLPRVNYNARGLVSTSPAIVDLLRRHVGRRPSSFGVHFGALLSGSAQIRCRAYRDHLVAKFNKKLNDLDAQRRKRGDVLSERVVGGEMEGVGLLAMPPSGGVTSWTIVKGVSDFADEEHQSDNESHRLLASKNAIRLVLDAFACPPPAEPQDA